MSDVFRIMDRSTRNETHRLAHLIDACAVWVKDPKKLIIEQIPAGSTTPLREVGLGECCSVLRAWFATDMHFDSDAERANMAQLIQEACPQQKEWKQKE